MIDILKKELTMDFDSAVDHIQKVLLEGGFSVMGAKAIDEIFKNKLGIMDHPRYTVITACGPKLAKMALEASLNTGLLFPCSFVVYEENEKLVVSHVSIMKSAVLLGLASEEAMKPVIAETGKMVGAVWEKI